MKHAQLNVKLGNITMTVTMYLSVFLNLRK
jgi:hypothetical protein